MAYSMNRIRCHIELRAKYRMRPPLPSASAFRRQYPSVSNKGDSPFIRRADIIRFGTFSQRRIHENGKSAQKLTLNNAPRSQIPPGISRALVSRALRSIDRRYRYSARRLNKDTVAGKTCVTALLFVKRKVNVV